MGKTAFDLETAEQALLDSFDGHETSTVTQVVFKASQELPASTVRKAYWKLVQDGQIEVSSSGKVRRHSLA